MKKKNNLSTFEKDILRIKTKKRLSVFLSIWVALGILAIVNFAILNNINQPSITPETIDSYIETGKMHGEEKEESTFSLTNFISNHISSPEEDINISKESLNMDGYYYCYEKLTDEEKKMYEKILYALNKRLESIELESENEFDLSVVYQCVLADHPEIFYTEGFEYKEYENRKNIVKSFEPIYMMNVPEIDVCKKRLEEFTARFMAKAPVNGTEYDKAKYSYDFVINNTEYDRNVEYNQEISSILIYGKSVCNGYAKMYEYLTQKLGLCSTLVIGFAGSEAHAWNAVKIDNKWYYVDPTWGDTSYTNSKDKIINYDCFCVTTEDIERTHVINNVVDPPVCNSCEANYYYHENLYLDSYNAKQLKEIFDKAYTDLKEILVFRCKDRTTYSKLYLELIDKQGIMDLYSEDTKEIEFIANEKTLSFKFYL